MLNDDEQFYMEREFTGWGDFDDDHGLTQDEEREFTGWGDFDDDHGLTQDDEELDDIDDYDSDPEYDYPGLESMRGDDETMHYRAG